MESLQIDVNIERVCDQFGDAVVGKVMKAHFVKFRRRHALKHRS